MPDSRFSFRVLVPYPLEEVFDFFSRAENLNLLTPPWAHFAILTPQPIEMRQGAVIRYRIRLRGIPVRWDSEITAGNPPLHFTDTQIRGPYRFWIHRHEFEETPEGTLATDDITYRVPGGPIVNRMYVAGELRRIFAYRTDTLKELFP